MYCAFGWSGCARAPTRGRGTEGRRGEGGERAEGSEGRRGIAPQKPLLSSVFEVFWPPPVHVRAPTMRLHAWWCLVRGFASIVYVGCLAACASRVLCCLVAGGAAGFAGFKPLGRGSCLGLTEPWQAVGLCCLAKRGAFPAVTPTCCNPSPFVTAHCQPSLVRTGWRGSASGARGGRAPFLAPCTIRRAQGGLRQLAGTG